MMLSIIIPCYNEEGAIPLLYKHVIDVLKEIGMSYELIFVNDGSKDNTLLQLKLLAKKDNHVKYISFSRNFGKESSMLAGLSYASGQAVIIMDADLQHPPLLIKEMINAFHAGYDQVIAKRTRTGDSVSKTFFAKMYYKIVNHLTDVEMVDGVGDFRLLSRKAVDALLSLKESNRFSKGLFSWIGFKQKIIEYENQERQVGETKWSLKKLFNYGVQGILSFNDKPLRITFQLGLVCVLMSFLYILWTFITILKEGVTVGGYFTTISAILVIGGVQLISIGVLGEYIGKIYYEVKKRPPYLIDDTNINVKESEHDIV
ncbi:glycosyltransferase family 2 protein [Carnobacteriaceae bacterium zg-84]|uniref:glycosyltransferase family 2 protein n=1 Tax=Granulicatella sp. zg-84 TaxID=2678503 RepID=UPI0013C258B3|nr:glycosyltransferase family 2 protein [Granulicatella sp. zg-84]NEW65397.1 glycosyltransferase [Granulicatella sp. zg-84]NEW66864.1 glycosyltransferase [Granulicatella sp. zg-84]QMI85091.1 glycosyltransferase family 2 protein [Carnobacteriaceae bacterium zg-84]